MTSQTQPLRRAYQMLRPTYMEKMELKKLFAGFAADYCYEPSESLRLEADGVTITRTLHGKQDKDWAFVKCSCGRIDIRCADADAEECFGCNREIDIVNRRKDRKDQMLLAA